MLTEKDLIQIKDHGLTLKKVIRQLETFAKGIPFVEIISSATVNNGIQKLSQEQKEDLVAYYDKVKDEIEIVKFVPASGAATRMFKFLFEFLETFDPVKETYKYFVQNNKALAIESFFKRQKEFAFINLLRTKIRARYPEFKKTSQDLRKVYLLRTLLEEEGLNYGNLPKGLIPFHKYKKQCATAFEEQLLEGAHYASVGEDVYMHFTFSEAHVDLFKKEFKGLEKRISRKTKKKFHITYSFQDSATDTIALTPENKPLRNNVGKLIFRPSGHGALLKNLNDVDSDVIFIKNIDNVACETYLPETVFYKKILAAKLLIVQKKIFYYLEKLEAGEDHLVPEIVSFLFNEFQTKNIPTEKESLQKLLNRPLRVCGVVENTGAPGGGPFWIKELDGTISLQIVESAQINLQDAQQQKLFKDSTHFNPVDIVCGVRDYKGNKFNLETFSNPKAGFISTKSENGKSLKALELPGLWNGSMAYWNTLLVEVPLTTFNPVKTVNDLLKKAHRPDL